MPQFNGLVEIRDGDGNTTISLDGDTGDIAAGGAGQAGNLAVRNAADAPRVSIDGETGTVTISTSDGDALVTVDGQEGDVTIARTIAGVSREVFRFDASDATLVLGAAASAGELVVRDGDGREVFRFDSSTSALYVGATGNEGDIIVRDGAGRDVFHLDAGNAALYVGATGNEGDIIVRDGSGRNAFHFDANNAALYIGASDNEGDVIVLNNDGNETIRLNGGGGDIILSNGDAAEDFEVVEGAEASPGTVMVLGEDGRLRPCSGAYDRAVVGVVAGAGSYRPGIVLDRRPADGRRLPISVMGKAMCRADAGHGPIRAGDLLTSSSSVGCAMRAADPQQAFGAVIGKALTPLDDGSGLVEMLIGLQ